MTCPTILARYDGPRPAFPEMLHADLAIKCADIRQLCQMAVSQFRKFNPVGRRGQRTIPLRGHDGNDERHTDKPDDSEHIKCRPPDHGLGVKWVFRMAPPYRPYDVQRSHTGWRGMLHLFISCYTTDNRNSLACRDSAVRSRRCKCNRPGRMGRKFYWALGRNSAPVHSKRCSHHRNYRSIANSLRNRSPTWPHLRHRHHPPRHEFGTRPTTQERTERAFCAN